MPRYFYQITQIIFFAFDIAMTKGYNFTKYIEIFSKERLCICTTIISNFVKIFACKFYDYKYNIIYISIYPIMDYEIIQYLNPKKNVNRYKFHECVT